MREVGGRVDLHVVDELVKFDMLRPIRRGSGRPWHAASSRSWVRAIDIAAGRSDTSIRYLWSVPNPARLIEACFGAVGVTLVATNDDVKFLGFEDFDLNLMQLSQMLALAYAAPRTDWAPTGADELTGRRIPAG